MSEGPKPDSQPFELTFVWKEYLLIEALEAWVASVHLADSGLKAILVCHKGQQTEVSHLV